MLSENLKQYIKNKYLKLERKAIPYLSIYENYLDKNYQFLEGRFIEISDETNGFEYYIDQKSYYFFFNIIELKYYNYQPKLDKSTHFCSSYELEEIFKKEKCKVYIMLNGKKCFIKDIFNESNSLILGNEKEVLFYVIKDNPPDYKINDPLKIGFSKNISTSKLGKYFYNYFKWDKKKDEICFWKSNKRNSFISLINKFQFDKTKYKIKIFGPSSIGKSMSLFIMSRIYNNIIYLNLKTLNEFYQIKDFLSIYEIIIEECQFLTLNIDQEKELNQIFKTNFGNDQWDLINNLVDFLLKINCFVLIIFDQFKSDVINNNIYSKILKTLYNQNIKYVSILICISSNDKDFREKFIECLMKQPENNFSKIQNKFIYFDSLGNFKDYNDRSNEKINLIINYFGEIPKYRLIFNNLEDYNYPEQIDLIKIKIKKNLEKLYEKLIPNNQKNSGFFKEYMINCLFTLKKQINEKIKYKYLKDILSIISLKYYTLHFYEDYFQFEYSFKLIDEVVNEIINVDVKNFFTKSYNLTHSGYAIADYFEMSVISALQNNKLKLPRLEEKNEPFIIEVKEIVKMNELILKLSDSLKKKILLFDLKENILDINEIKNTINNLRNQLKDKNNILDSLILYDKDTLNHFKLKFYEDLYQRIEKNPNLKMKGINIGNFNVLIKQTSGIGKCVDISYLTGKSDDKSYFGFQIKAYDGNKSKTTNFRETKNMIKQKHKEIFNSLYTLGININKWHYTVIIFFKENQNENEKQYSEDIVKFCKNNSINYIFYEPLNEIFYDNNLNKIDSFEPSFLSNLDNFNDDYCPNNFISEEFYSNFYQSEFLKEVITKKIYPKQIIESSINNFLKKKTTNQKKENGLITFCNDIKKELEVHCIKLMSEGILYVETDIPKPQKNILFCFKGKNEKLYIAVNISKYNFIKYFSYNYNKFEEIQDPCNIFNQIDKSQKFQVFKIIDSKTRSGKMNK